MRTIQRAIITVGALGWSLTAAACDDGDPEADVPATATPPAPPSPPTTATSTPPTTAPSVVANTDPATTTPAPTTSTQAPPTTIDEEALKAEIAEDFVAADRRLTALVADPASADLPSAVAQVAVGRYAELIESRLSQLVAEGKRVVPGDPPVHDVTVESVEVVDDAHALVVSCLVDNSQEIQVGASGEPDRVTGASSLAAVREQHPVTLTEHGWLIEDYDSTAIGVYVGEDSCPVD